VSCYAFNGLNPQKLTCSATGHLKVNVENALTLDKSGLATDTLQTSGNASLTSIDTKLVACDTGNVVVSNITTCDTANVAGSVSVSNFPATQPVSAVALPLPTGASTSALQTSGNASLTSMDTKITACDTGAIVVASGTISVSNFPAEQNVKINSVLKSGTYQNLNAGTSLTPSGETSDIDVSNMKYINVVYEDTATSSYNGLNVLASGDGGTNYNTVNQLYPQASGSTRYAFLSMNVGGLTNLKLKNTSSTDTYTAVSASGFGSL
jgi:hypothetical protein